MKVEELMRRRITPYNQALLQEKTYNSNNITEYFQDLQIYKNENRLVGHSLEYHKGEFSARIEYLDKSLINKTTNRSNS